MKRLPLKPALLRAFLEGRKTVTRRLINPQPKPEWTELAIEYPYGKAMLTYRAFPGRGTARWQICTPKYQPGDIVGIGEPWLIPAIFDEHAPNDFIHVCETAEMPMDEVRERFVIYRNDLTSETIGHPEWGKWRTGRFLPDALVRHKARIVSVRAERLQEITELDAQLEGMATIRDEWAGQCQDFDETLTDLQLFQILWDHIHGKEAPWSSNPWVFRYEIARVPA